MKMLTIKSALFYRHDNGPATPPIEKCTESTFEHFVGLYGMQIVISLIYSAMTDQCENKNYFDCINMILGIFYLAAYDLDKLLCLILFLILSLSVVSILQFMANQMDTKFPTHIFVGMCLLGAVYLDYNKMGELPYYGLRWKTNKWMLFIAMMKISSVADRCDNTFFEDFFSPPFWGYMFSPINTLYGPWISIDTYNDLYIRQECSGSDYEWSVRKMWTVSKLFFYSYCCHQAANCVLPDLINNNAKFWLLLYRRSLCFRCNHYARSHMASASMLIAGYNQSSLPRWKFTITSPPAVEFPRSIVSMVQNFDRQVYSYYSQYLSKFCTSYGEVQLAWTLHFYLLICYADVLDLYIGFTMIFILMAAQSKFMNASAYLLSSCIKSEKCIYCKHVYKSNSIIVRILLLAIGLLNVILVTYVFLYFDEQPLYTMSGEEVKKTTEKAELLGKFGLHTLLGFVVAAFLFRDYVIMHRNRFVIPSNMIIDISSNAPKRNFSQVEISPKERQEFIIGRT